MADALARASARLRFPVVNVALFLATVATTTAIMGPAFSAALLGILLTHEMGHYLAARRYGVDATLPYFIPFPLGIGTFGAVIRIRSQMPSRRATLDIGVAGPIAGFLVAFPLLLWGLAHSEIRPVDLAPAAERVSSGIDVLLAIAREIARLVSGAAAPSGGPGEIYLGDSVLTWLATRIAVGPLPPGQDVVLHPVGLAAWIGLLVTALNLVPIGQLDGGHVTYALLGRSGAERTSRAISVVLFLTGAFLSFNWLVWWALSRFLVGPRHPPSLVEEPLGPGRRALAVAALVLLALVFAPVPVAS
jgi:membrane-associated protease RseP (regulator of RpoE activity)